MFSLPVDVDVGEVGDEARHERVVRALLSHRQLSENLLPMLSYADNPFMNRKDFFSGGHAGITY